MYIKKGPRVLMKSRNSGLPTRRFRRVIDEYKDALKKGVDPSHSNDPGDYTNNGNPELIKYQQQEPDKTANFLGKVWKQTDYDNYQDINGWGYYDNPYQKLVLSLGLNDPATVLSEKEFNEYVKQTGARVFYRGWSREDSADRFLNGKFTHTGAGRYGDGIYFTPDLSTARQFAGYGSGDKITKMALSPTARVISYSDLISKMNAMTANSPKLRSSFHKAGTVGQRNIYDDNDGEAQAALKLGYNVVDMGGGYMFALTRDAFISSSKKMR